MMKCGHFGKQISNTWEVFNVVLEKDEEDQLDRSCEKRRRTVERQGGNEYSTYINRKEG